jgi:Holliday junction DNA helicase RuvA
MYDYIIGSLEEQGLDYVVIDLHHMGYKIKVSVNTLNELPNLHCDIKLYLHQVIKDDEVVLYGFVTKDERELFRTIIGISGIGPKAGTGLLSQFTRDELIHHILNNDPKSIAKAPGIGIKTASRLILELKDRYKDYAVSTAGLPDGRKNLKTDHAQEAINGLLSLGFSLSEGTEMVNGVYISESSVEDLVKNALKATNPLKGQ